MQINKKYFSPPPKNPGDFKQLFQLAVREGVGLPADEDGFPLGQWTPEIFADAVANIKVDKSGLELRTVQHWFQDNDRGVSAGNIRWIARVFGCGDPDKTAIWMRELAAAHSRMVAARRSRKLISEIENVSLHEEPQREEEDKTVGGIQTALNGSHATHDFHQIRSFSQLEAVAGDAKPAKLPFGVALRSEWVFSNQPPMSLAIAIWTGLALLWLLAYLMGVHSITYYPVAGLEKQVGFNTNPAWIIGEPIFLPVTLILVSDLLRYWRQKGRGKIDTKTAPAEQVLVWEKYVSSFRRAYWMILFVGFVMIFAVQWTFVYLIPLLKGATDLRMVDWITVGIIRSDIVSTPMAITVSMLGFLYTGFLYWLYFTAFMLLYTITSDFSQICQFRMGEVDEAQKRVVRHIGVRILNTTYRCAISGLLIALFIRLNAAYLITDTENIISWLMQDAAYGLGMSAEGWSYIDGSPSPFLTSFLLAFVTIFLFGYCAYVIMNAIDSSMSTSRIWGRTMRTLLAMLGVLMLLSLNFLLVGQFQGFSILLLVAVVVSIIGLFSPVRLTDANS